MIVGYGGHAKSMADSIRAESRYEIAGYTDIEDKHDKDLEYLGSDESLPDIYRDKCCYAAIGIGYMGNSNVRDRLYRKLKEIGYQLPAIIDPAATVSQSAQIGEGAFVGKGAVVNAGACIGKLCIINTGAIVEHGNVVGDYSHISVGSILCGHVSVGDHCFIGAGSTVIQGIEIGKSSIIGARSVVLKNVPEWVKAYNIVLGG